MREQQRERDAHTDYFWCASLLPRCSLNTGWHDARASNLGSSKHQLCEQQQQEQLHWQQQVQQQHQVAAAAARTRTQMGEPSVVVPSGAMPLRISHVSVSCTSNEKAAATPRGRPEHTTTQRSGSSMRVRPSKGPAAHSQLDTASTCRQHCTKQMEAGVQSLEPRKQLGSTAISMRAQLQPRKR